MRTRIVCVVFAFVLMCPSAFGQGVQAPHHPLMGTKVVQGTPSELFGLPTQYRMETDSLRVKRSQPPLTDRRFIPNGIERSPHSPRRTSTTQSQIYVIDTAIVRSTQDTTRHLYTFNANAKRTSDLTQKLNGDLWVDTLRETNTYDANGNMLTDFSESWANGKWVANDRYTRTYDANGRETSSMYESWSNGQMVQGSRNTSTYDVNGNLLTSLDEGWVNGQWVNSVLRTYTYNVNGMMLTGLWQEWANGRWVNVVRDTGTTDGNTSTGGHEKWWSGRWVKDGVWITVTYDAQGNILSSIEQHWSNDYLMSTNRTTDTYDANGRLVSGLSEHLSFDVWWTDARVTYVYGATGNVLARLDELWANGQWENSSRETYTYDASNHKLSSLSELWSNGQWVKGGYCSSAAYDANGNMLFSLYEFYSMEDGHLADSTRDTYTYDANGNTTSYSWEDFLNGQGIRDIYTYDKHGNLTSFSYYTLSHSAWAPTDYRRKGVGGYFVYDSTGNFYHFGSGYNFTLIRRLVVTGVAAPNPNVPAVCSLSQNYPNPFNPSTRIKYTVGGTGGQGPGASRIRLVVYDVLGREVAVPVDEKKAAGTYEMQFDASALASGVYIYRLQAGDFVQSKKFILLK